VDPVADPIVAGSTRATARAQQGRGLSLRAPAALPQQAPDGATRGPDHGGGGVRCAGANVGGASHLSRATHLGPLPRPRPLGPPLARLPGITRHEVGDTEVRILFPVGMLPEVARAIQARRRRPAPPAASLQALADHRHGSDFRGRGSRRPALAIP
jgi:hypothetical protein